MDLSFLIPSKTRRLVLEYFITNPGDQMGVRELARKIQLAPQLVYRELINMENWGFLFSSKRGNQRAYRVNKKFVYFEGLQNLWDGLAKTKKPLTVIKQLDWKELRKHYDSIEISETMVAGLKSKRSQPRSWDEYNFLKKQKALANE